MKRASIESASKSVFMKNPRKKEKFNKQSSRWDIENLPIIEDDGRKENEENDQNQENISSSAAESFANSSVIDVIVDDNSELIDNLNASNEFSNTIQKNKFIGRGDNLLRYFFHNVVINGKRISANCISCEKSYKADFSSMSNLSGHLKVKRFCKKIENYLH